MMSGTVSSSAMVYELAALCGVEHTGGGGGIVTVAPGNTQEVAAVLQLANQRGYVVRPQGGGTKQDWCEEREAAILLLTHRMNRVVEHVWQDMTCTVEAGCTWSSMQATLAKHGQFVALDPVFAERASAGGICAVNDSGALRLKYGSLRDLVIGMTLVLADGTVANTGGKVVKNVAGYDLHKLMTGAFGTLGVITEVTFRLHSIPPHSASFTVESTEVESLGKMLLQVIDSHLSAECLQIRSVGTSYRLDVELATLPEVVEAQAAMLAGMARGLGLAVIGTKANVWGARQVLLDDATAFVAKATMMPSEIAMIAEGVSKLGGRSVTQAVGVMIASIPESGADGLLALRQRIEQVHGSLVLLRRPANSAVERWGRLPDTLPLMREIKRRFDPKGILNAGRFVGGI